MKNEKVKLELASEIGVCAMEHLIQSQIVQSELDARNVYREFQSAYYKIADEDAEKDIQDRAKAALEF